MKEWLAFLKAGGAVIEEQAPLHFGDPAAEALQAQSGGIIADRSDFGFISVTGADAAQFLQGQCTNDIRDVSLERSQLSGLCSPKGRMLASFRIIGHPDGYTLHLPRSLLDNLLKRLRMYVLRSAVSLQDASGRLVAISFQGDQAAAEASRSLGDLPAEIDAARRYGDTTIIRLQGDRPRYTMIGDFESMRDLWRRMGTVAAPVGPEAWALTGILAGVPVIGVETADAFVPQMVNFQAIGGVSFTKGCYTGQEVVARTEYLGKLKRRMYRARVEADLRPRPGEDLYAPGCVGDQSAGKVVNAQIHPAGGYEMLAVLQVEAAEKCIVRLRGPAGPTLTLESLPYSLETR